MWPISGIAQQLNIPIIGFLTARSENETAESIAAFRDGLQEAGYRKTRWCDRINGPP